MLIDTPRIYYSPIKPFAYHYKLLTLMDAVELDKQFKALREAKSIAISALALYSTTDNPTFINLSENDPPDGYIMRHSKEKKGTLEILKVEITHYFNNNGETLLEQLKRTKIPAKPIHGPEYLILVELRTPDPINYEEIRDYLNSINNPFPVWTIRPLQITPDTIAELVIINPEIHTIVVNAGEAAYNWKQNKLPNEIDIKRVAKVEDVRFEELKTKHDIKPKWEIETERRLSSLGLKLP